jgi:phage N-6-adenine-methyltransferase
MNEKTMKTMFSSKTEEWETPQKLYDHLNLQYNFTLDPCATSKTAKCENYYTIEDDGLNKNWEGEIVFMNPPYGRDIKHWIKKAYEEGQKPNTMVVCLIPSRTDTKYWHEYCMKAWKINFVKGRLKFKNDAAASNAAPFPSAVVVFKNTKGCGAHGMINVSTMEVR